MPTESVPLGPAVTLRAGVAYAVPGVNCVIHTDAAGASLTQSNTLQFTASNPVTLNGGVGQVTGAFIKAVADTLVVMKKA
jgi:hypothetical protein